MSLAPKPRPSTQRTPRDWRLLPCDQHGVQTIQRAMLVLREVASRARFGLGLSEIAERCGLDKATTHRILRCLMAEGMVRQRADRRYMMGTLPYELSLAHPAHAALQEIVRVPLARIASDLHGIAGLMLRSSFDGVYAARAGRLPIKGLSVEVGDRRPLAMMSAGLAMVCNLPRAEGARILRHNRQQLTALGFDRMQGVERMIKRARAAGYGINLGDTVKGVCAIAVPIRDRHGRPFAALSLGRPIENPDQADIDSVAATLRQAAGSIETAARDLWADD